MDDDTAALDARFGIGGALGVAMRPLGGPVVEMTHAGARAVVSIQGGQVLSYVPAPGAQDVLWLSPVARIVPGKSIRGGIPVCWPWFGPHAADGALPAHGFVRTAMWSVVGTSGDLTGVRLRLAWPPPGHGTPSVPGLPSPALTLAVEVTLSDRLTVDLVTANDSAQDIAITAALHSYLAVGDVTRVTITGLEGRDYIDKVDGGTVKRQGGAIVVDREVDRVFQGTADRVTVTDPQFGRRIHVDKSGSASTVVWNPWIDKAARLGDLGPAGHMPFVCVETANAGADQRTLAPGTTHTLRTELTSEPI